MNSVRGKRAFLELKRKSFHLVGLLIPFIYYLGLHYSGGLLTRGRALLLLGSLTAFLWLVELLRWISPSFRARYNLLFRKIMRKSELAAPTMLESSNGALPPAAVSAFAAGVDSLVQTLTTPLLGELPATPQNGVPTPRGRSGLVTPRPSGFVTPRGGSSPSARSRPLGVSTSSSLAASVRDASIRPLAQTLQEDYLKQAYPGMGLVPVPPADSQAANQRPPTAESEKIFTGEHPAGWQTVLSSCNYAARCSCYLSLRVCLYAHVARHGFLLAGLLAVDAAVHSHDRNRVHAEPGAG